MPDLQDYLRDLNPEQLAAVRYDGSRLLILAGAGSGKTRVITTRIAWLVRECNLEPESILAVTFTNKAAREMRDRAAASDPACSRAFLRTFHSFGAWFLRRNAAAAGLDPNFTIYDDDDSVTLLHGTAPELTRAECGAWASRIARAKDYGLAPDSPDLESRFPERNFRRIYAGYERRLRETGNTDFGDLILLPARILRDDGVIRSRFHQRFRALLVDEYQDSNLAQFELLKLMAAGGAGLCVVGDDDQSIYRFRGAEVRNILEFPKVFPGTEIVRLERNYRSFQSILDVAASVVARNEGRLGKTLRAVKPAGPKPILALLSDQDEEAAYAARAAQTRVARTGRWSDTAVLYRTNAQSLAFEHFFARLGIPYRIVGSVRFYQREEVKDALAYLAVLANPRDEVNFRRAVQKPARGVGDVSIEAVLAEAYRSDGNLVEAARRVGPSFKTSKSRSGLASFVSMAGGLRALLEKGEVEPLSLSSLVERVIRESGLVEYHRGRDEVAGAQRASNLDELQNAAADFPMTLPGLAEFLETIELDRRMADQEESLDAVTLITMHNTKGLEFPVVVLTGLDQGLFPRDDDEGEDLEEQRRLFYVAATRAMEELHLTTCRSRMIRGRWTGMSPSSFIHEIPQGLYEPLMGRLPSAPPAAGLWKPGLTVYHDEHGPGYVVQVKTGTSDTGPLVFVRFETGRTLQFFPKFTRKLEAVR
ncbi:MAG TPA: UvrD-helicase domain-containing protein [Magnetospirillaceae bacterium]|nr:UvrD-helicase domain-containing protein [Magnetospirillaceae bacterium]